MATINERLMKAAQSGSETELKALLMDSGCDALVGDCRGWTALMMAAYDGHEACVRILQPVSDAHNRNKNGQTALMWAACNGQEACVRLLLPVSDALAADKGGLTALMWAAAYGNEDCVQLLLPLSDVQATDKDSLTASTWARSRGKERVGIFIDAYILAHSERDSIEAAAGRGASSKKSGPRV